MYSLRVPSRVRATISLWSELWRLLLALSGPACIVCPLQTIVKDIVGDNCAQLCFVCPL